MASRIPLLLAVLAAACLGFGSAEGDPLPAAVVELVKSGSVSSMQDLQFLLFSESIEVYPDNHNDNDSSNRLPRSLLDAQPAQQAVCKVRTEVTEVTRSMLDRSNANFLLWPPCVEVQRCSGCCNTKSLQCVPVLTHTRYLQVMKIQYVNKRPLYDKAVISVLDHVECRCQPAPRPAQRKKSPTSKQDRSGKSRSKGELHHRDEFKHNQKLSLEDLLTHSWIHKDRLSESGAPDAFLPSGDFKPHLGRDGWGLNETQYGGGKGHHHYPVDARRHHGNVNDTGVGSAKRMTFPLPNYTEQEETEKDDSSLSNFTKAVEQERSNAQVESQNNANQSIINQTSEYKTTAMELTNKTLKRQSNLTQGTPDNFAVGTNQMDRLVSNSTEKINQNGGDLGLSLEEDNKTSDVERRDDERKGNGMNFSPERKAKDEEMEDLLLLHKLVDDGEKHKHHLKAQQSNREHDEKLEEFNHKQHTTTQQTGTISPPLQRSPPHTPPRPPPHPPKRRRKQRNRISKSAMRALLM